MVGNQPLVDLRDTRLAVGVVIDTVEWLLIREKKRLGPQDVTRLLKDLDLARSVLSDETAGDD